MTVMFFLGVEARMRQLLNYFKITVYTTTMLSAGHKNAGARSDGCTQSGTRISF